MMQTVLIQIQQKKTQQLPLIQTVQMLIPLMMQQMLLKQNPQIQMQRIKLK